MKITAQELRIGNITNKGTIKSFYENGVHVGFGKTFNFNELEPIPLTEEWLVKLGCEVFEFDYKENQYRIFDRLIVKRTDGFFEYGTSVKLSYVHTFQNLIFALTNQELELSHAQ